MLDNVSPSRTTTTTAPERPIDRPQEARLQGGRSSVRSHKTAMRTLRMGSASTLEIFEVLRNHLDVVESFATTRDEALLVLPSA